MIYHSKRDLKQWSLDSVVCRVSFFEPFYNPCNPLYLSTFLLSGFPFYTLSENSKLCRRAFGFGAFDSLKTAFIHI